jgi:hypothetical protein
MFKKIVLDKNSFSQIFGLLQENFRLFLKIPSSSPNVESYLRKEFGYSIHVYSFNWSTEETCHASVPILYSNPETRRLPSSCSIFRVATIHNKNYLIFIFVDKSFLLLQNICRGESGCMKRKIVWGKVKHSRYFSAETSLKFVSSKYIIRVSFCPVFHTAPFSPM